MIGKYADELHEGDTFTSHRRTITEADVVLFTSLTWINDPIFTDDTFAQRTHFGARGIPGPMLMAYSLGLTEELVYGTTLAAMGINNVRFRRSCRPGTTLEVKTVIGSHRPSGSRPGNYVVEFKHEVFDVAVPEPELVCTFERMMLVGDRAHVESLGR